ncbi:MAG: cytochrome b5 domain-containing protein [Candidatus Pacebacteria bacterium]|nr:cytochrome b5 domain-containing protein [Candidatus Paceibacterota bacterium]MCF7863014.1 cytochrome b5 domain-containing protein [Candidatus Paceibacterota bacterium]
MNKKVYIALIICIILAFAGFYLFNNKTQNTEQVDNNSKEISADSINSNVSENSNPSISTDSNVSKTFTIEEVATYNTEANCYSAINGVVYDLTKWINKHPGGDRNILRICGLDGSETFNGQHGESKKVGNILAGFEVGVLSN